MMAVVGNLSARLRRIRSVRHMIVALLYALPLSSSAIELISSRVGYRFTVILSVEIRKRHTVVHPPSV